MTLPAAAARAGSGSGTRGLCLVDVGIDYMELEEGAVSYYNLFEKVETFIFWTE
jgi:hypothetical protein